MAISFKCGGCGKDYTVKDELAGKRAQCKKCGQVMKVPVLALSSEPNLLDDDQDSHANTETVAGSLITTPLETVAGRGSSAAGRSAAGRSASGASQGQPPAADYGQPSLSSLKQVAQSDQEAFDVRGGTDQPLRQARGPASKNRAAMEPFSFLLILVMVAALVYAAFATASSPPQAAAFPADVVSEAGKAWSLSAARYGIYLVMALAVLGPLVMGAWFAALKIVNVRNCDGWYVRSLGIASVAVALVAVMSAGPLSRIDGVGLAVALVSIGACYALLHFLQGQKPAVAAITTAIAAVAGYGGILGMQRAADAVAGPMEKTYERKLAYIVDDRKAKQLALANKPKEQLSAVAPSAADAVAADDTVKALQKQVADFKAALSNKRQTRERLAMTAESLSASVAAARNKFPDRTEWAALVGELDSTRAQVESFATAAPPAELNEAPPAGADWSSRAGRKEISVHGFNLTAPVAGRVDLDAATVGGPLRWQVGDARTGLTIEHVTALSPQQQRPWVAPAFVVDSTKDTVVAVAAEGDAQVEYGTINGLSTAKVTIADAQRPGLQSVVYVLHKGTTWLKCTIGPAAATDDGFNAATQAVRTLRERPAGEPVLDPMPAADLVARFGEDPKLLDKVTTLIKGKPNGEDAVLKGLGFAPDDSTLERFAPLLIATATEKSSNLLWKIAAGNFASAASARDALRTLEPKNADDIAFAVLDLKSTSPSQVKKGLDALVNADADKARQPAVAKVLAAKIEQNNLLSTNAGPVIEAALGKWMDDEVAKKVAVVVQADSVSADARKSAMRVLAATGNKKYVRPIMMQYVKEPEATSETLIAMGSVAEGDVALMLAEPRADVRMAGLRILDEIGTARSLSAIQTCASRSGDAEVKETAKALFLKIKDRGNKPAQPN